MIENLLTFSLTVFTGFFAIMNPIANIPVFLGLVGNKSEKSKKEIAKKATLTAFIIVVTFVVFGKLIFELFGITIPAFKITGGILLFYVGFEMLQSRKSKIHNQKDEDEDDGVAISPLAIPILAGPGTIVTAMNFVTDGGFIHIGIIIAVFGLMIILTYIAFTLSNVIVEKLGNNLITVVVKFHKVVDAFLFGLGKIRELGVT